MCLGIMRFALTLTDNDVAGDEAAGALLSHQEAELAGAVAGTEERVLRTAHGGHHRAVATGQKLGAVVRVRVHAAGLHAPLVV